jgi:hypothetical protein
MTAADLMAQLQSRGVRFQVERGTLQVAPRAALTEKDRTAIREHLIEVKALVLAAADSDMHRAGDVLAGAVVVYSGPLAWPPEGATVPLARGRIDPFAAAAPTVPCPSCRVTSWHRAGSGWACVTCHPAPKPKVGSA